jgi:hypothetical protein
MTRIELIGAMLLAAGLILAFGSLDLGPWTWPAIIALIVSGGLFLIHEHSSIRWWRQRDKRAKSEAEHSGDAEISFPQSQTRKSSSAQRDKTHSTDNHGSNSSHDSDGGIDDAGGD